MVRTMMLTVAAGFVLMGLACKKEALQQAPEKQSQSDSDAAHGHAGHAADGHDDGDHGNDDDDDHGHDAVPLGTTTIGDVKVELAQGDGVVAAGKEGLLLVKLSYSDRGQTIVRAWIGTEDRLSSVVGKGTYAPSHDDYDVHAEAPDPLPDNVMWWIEIEKPDGTKALGSIKPLTE